MSKFQLNVVHKGTKKPLKLTATDTVAQLLEQAVDVLALNKPLAEYVVYNPSSAARQRWLANELIVSEHLKEQQDVEVITRWMMVRVELWAPSTSNVPSKILSTKYLALDAFVPLRKFLQIAAKKIQLEDMDAFGLYNDNIVRPLLYSAQYSAQSTPLTLAAELDLDHSLRDLDIKLTRVPPRDQPLTAPQSEDAEQRNNSGHLLLVLKNKKAFSDLQEGHTGMTSTLNSESGSAIFGAPLSRAIKSGQSVPQVLLDCAAYLSSKLEVEGLFRLSGSQNDIDRYQAEYDKGHAVDLSKELDPHCVAGIFKLYLRVMPEPLLTFERYSAFINAQQERDVKARAQIVRRLVRSLPADHYNTLKFLFELLSRVEKLSAVNKMAVHNLATVFGPNLLRLPGAQENMLQLVEDTPIVNGLVNTLLKDFDAVFGDNEDDKPLEARALFAYTSQGPNQIDLAQNQVVCVLSAEGKDGWVWIDDYKGHTGVVPASYLKNIDSNEGKRLKFMEDMEVVRRQLDAEQLKFEQLSDLHGKLTHVIEHLTALIKLGGNSNNARENDSVKQRLRDQGPAKASQKFEVFYSKIEGYNKSKLQLQQTRAPLYEELLATKKMIAADLVKYKKVKDLLPKLDELLSLMSEEIELRKVSDENKEQLFKDLTDIRVIFQAFK